MAATHAWKETGSGGEVTATNINFGSVDAPNLVPATYPITRGTNSFSKYIRCLFTDSWTEISNMKFWKSAGALDAEEKIKASFNATYAAPSQTGTGDSDVPTSEPASNVNSFEGDATIVYGATGVSGYTGYIRLQGQYTSSMPSGAVAQKTFTFQYDET